MYVMGVVIIKSCSFSNSSPVLTMYRHIKTCLKCRLKTIVVFIKLVRFGQLIDQALTSNNQRKRSDVKLILSD